MITTLDILNELSATPKRLEKERILRRERDTPSAGTYCQIAFRAAYNPDITYWIKKHPEYIRDPENTVSLAAAIAMLDDLVVRAVTGHAAVAFYASILSRCSDDDAEVIRRIIDRDLKCGVRVPTINKVWNNLIPDYSLALASTNPDKLVFPALCQIKYDGLRCLITHTDNGLIFRTRNGKTIDSLNTMSPLLVNELKQAIAVGETLDGELLIAKEPGALVSRQEGNGILNKAIRGTITAEEADDVIFVAWDIIDHTRTIPYGTRFGRIENYVDTVEPKKFFCAESVTVETMDDLQDAFLRALNRDHEGVIAKNIFSLYQPKRTRNMVKFKGELTADLQVIEWIPGKPGSKYEGMLGALVCATSDGKVQVNVGTGFSNAQRKRLTENKTVDRIIEVCYNQRIGSKSGKNDSLYLPRFAGFRDDKSLANSSNEVK
jgi:hypothetical protein